MEKFITIEIPRDVNEQIEHSIWRYYEDLKGRRLHKKEAVAEWLRDSIELWNREKETAA